MPVCAALGGDSIGSVRLHLQISDHAQRAAFSQQLLQEDRESARAAGEVATRKSLAQKAEESVAVAPYRHWVLPRLQCARRQVPAADGNGQVVADWFDVINMSSIERPVLIQADPTTTRTRFFYNPFIT